MTMAYVVTCIISDVAIPIAVTRDADFSEQLREKFASGRMPRFDGIATLMNTSAIKWIVVEVIDADTEKETIEATLVRAVRRAMKLE